MNAQVKVIAPVDIKSIAAPKRSRIRDLINSHFDDEKGCYVHGWSDERISKEVDIGIAFVVAIREAAYGPILTTPEKEDAKVELTRLRSEMDEKILSLSAEFDKKIKDLMAKITG